MARPFKSAAAFVLACTQYKAFVEAIEVRRLEVDRQTALERRPVRDLQLATLIAERSKLSAAIADHVAGVGA